MPSIRPFIATAIARPRTSGRVIWAHIEMPTPKKAWEAMPVMIRAAIIMA